MTCVDVEGSIKVVYTINRVEIDYPVDQSIVSINR